MDFQLTEWHRIFRSLGT